MVFREAGMSDCEFEFNFTKWKMSIFQENSVLKKMNFYFVQMDIFCETRISDKIKFLQHATIFSAHFAANF